MQAHGALVEFARVQHAVHRLERIDCARMCGVHLKRVRRFQFASALLDLLKHNPVILDKQASDGNRHPAILIAMIVNRADLADFPADGDQLVERRLIDQIARVVLAVPAQVGRQRVGRNLGAGEECDQLVYLIKSSRWKGAQLGDEVLNGDLFLNCLRTHTGTPQQSIFAREAIRLARK